MPYLDADGQRRSSRTKENALKFEMFIFDVLPLAERWTVVETTAREEFEPLKNATGADSPETVQQAISDLAADWLERAGVAVPRRPGHRLRWRSARCTPSTRRSWRARWTGAADRGTDVHWQRR